MLLLIADSMNRRRLNLPVGLSSRCANSGEWEHLLLVPLVARGEAKHVSSFTSRRRPSRVAGQQIRSSAPWAACAGRRMRHEKVRRRQKWALRSPASQLRARKAALPRRLRRLRRCGGGGRDVEGGGLARRSCAASPGALGQLRSPSAGGGVGLRTPFVLCPFQSTPQNAKPTPRAIRNGACLMKSNNSMCGPCSRRRRCTDIPPVGRTRPLKSSGTTSYCSQTGAETDKEIVKEEFGEL